MSRGKIAALFFCIPALIGISNFNYLLKQGGYGEIVFTGILLLVITGLVFQKRWAYRIAKTILWISFVSCILVFFIMYYSPDISNHFGMKATLTGMIWGSSSLVLYMLDGDKAKTEFGIA